MQSILAVYWLFFVLSAFVFLSGCASDRQAHADALAKTAGLSRAQIQTAPFLLTTYARVTDKTQPFNVYIEGDGMAWLSPYEPSLNPTPRKALGLHLASLDPAANVIYIARPCQFTPMKLDSSCREVYWTDRRFSEEVVASINQAVDQLAAPAKSPNLNLIGYSGGGAIAVLIAARRNDVLSIRTVAGNLDHTAFNRQHKATPLLGSLNPIDYARSVDTIPQIHFSGQDDDVIPPSIAQRFYVASKPTNCMKLRVIADVSHERGWVDHWPELLKDQPSCAAKVAGSSQ